ncbi:AAA family ATPase [Pseudomonas sp. IzPS59]|uniref:AAA family ATPase n=1 Tax=Pseudomonas sp. IzPS59 TaxID=2774459 RepID=UPI00178851FA|nr:AAA family ATPase [Pseudomonas sp. IzPS59]
MINAQRVEAMLKDRYPDLEHVGNGVFRGIDRFGKRDYAVRYFDLNDQLAQAAVSLKSYQEDVLSGMYFSSDVSTDLRWNHYLYFVTSEEEAHGGEFGRLKATIEADREYARKRVIQEDEIAPLLADAGTPQAVRTMPIDLATIWSEVLSQHKLNFILDSDITVPEAVRRIVAGATDTVGKTVSPVSLLSGEQAAVDNFIQSLTITGFRSHPEQKVHELGRVNLIVGSNGVGKTSLLEAIEFAYCGTNRRESPVLPKTSVVLDFGDTGEKLNSTTNTTRLRARHSSWYAKTDLKNATIQYSFAKFNFLDTDAAVELSVTSSSDQIGEDVTRLVLGAASEQLGDRLRRVLTQLQDGLKGLNRENVTNQRLKESSQKRLDYLKTIPKLSDSLFLELLTATRASGWIQPPAEKGQLDAFRDELQKATSAFVLIRRSSIDVLHSNFSDAQLILASLEDEARKAEALDQRAHAARLAQSNANREAQAAVESIAVTESLLPYARTDFSRLTQETQDLQERVRASSARLANIASLIDMQPIQTYLSQPLAAVIASVTGQVEESERRLESARLSLQTFEKSQSAMTVLKQRLLVAAQELLLVQVDPNHCPLCKTEFEEGQLLARMMSDIEGSTSEHAAMLQATITFESEELAKAKVMMATLIPVKSFVGHSDLLITVEEAIRLIDEEKRTLEQDRYELDACLSKIKNLSAEGLSSEDLSRKLLIAGLTELTSLDSLLQVQADKKELLSATQASSASAIEELNEIRQESEALAARLSIEVLDDTEQFAQAVKKQFQDLDAALGARQTLTSILAIDTESTTEQVGINLATMRQMLINVATAEAVETSNDTEFNQEASTIADLEAKIGKLDTQIKRAVEADAVLGELAQQRSSGELTNQILTENAAEIARTFASIHMPNEFELKTDQGKLAIIRRSNGAEVQLHQMSTGQRAAFALSLFLAMNGRLQSGPPILLFDDPVAHIDDINMLSFLDHLRDLAISGSRQIFFATADNKLAGLFRHKFRFLEDDFKELRLSRAS